MLANAAQLLPAAAFMGQYQWVKVASKAFSYSTSAVWLITKNVLFAFIVHSNKKETDRPGGAERWLNSGHCGYIKTCQKMQHEFNYYCSGNILRWIFILQWRWTSYNCIFSCVLTGSDIALEPMQNPSILKNLTTCRGYSGYRYTTWGTLKLQFISLSCVKDVQ